MRLYTVDYLEDRASGGRDRGTLFNRGLWVYRVPRLIPLCRLLGHKPVVDGVDFGTRGERSRWVCCDRCGIRPETQGRLDPDLHHIGQRYLGPYGHGLPEDAKLRAEVMRDLKGIYYAPGPWPAKPTGDVGGQLVLGKTFGGIGAEIKVGNSGSEQTLAASVRLHHLGALYLHTEQHGQWLQRRLNPTGYQSRVIELAIAGGRLRWRLWAKRDEHTSDTPRWQDGSIRIDPRDIVLGPVRHHYTDVVGPVPAIVRMPHGDDHEVFLKLQQVRTGRDRGRGEMHWSVDWSSSPGIPTKPGNRGHICGSHVDVSDDAVQQGTWPLEAVAAIAAQMTRNRIRYDYRPPEPAPEPV